MSQRAIPLIDLEKFRSGSASEKAAFVAEIGDAFQNIGFVGVVKHGIEKSLIEKFYRESKSFFALPVEIKRQYEISGIAGQRGYTSFGKEHAKHSAVADLKEFYQIGQYLDAGSPRPSDYLDNVEVSEAPEFLPTGIELFRAFERTGLALLEAIAIYLGLEEKYFAKEFQPGNSVLRAIHYPPITREPDSAIRAEQHEDINLITLLVGASAGGLQILEKNGEWRDVVPEKDEIVINVGDMLQRVTNNYLKSTTHRVVNPPRAEWHLPRLSIPFFLHPRKSMDLTCLEGCVSLENPAQYAPITAGAYLEERLKEIGLKA